MLTVLGCVSSGSCRSRAGTGGSGLCVFNYHERYTQHNEPRVALYNNTCETANKRTRGQHGSARSDPSRPARSCGESLLTLIRCRAALPLATFMALPHTCPMPLARCRCRWCQFARVYRPRYLRLAAALAHFVYTMILVHGHARRMTRCGLLSCPVYLPRYLPRIKPYSPSLWRRRPRLRPFCVCRVSAAGPAAAVWVPFEGAVRSGRLTGRRSGRRA